MTTKRLIDLYELLKYPIRRDHYDKEHGNVHFINGIESIIEYAEDLPIVDAVEVVHAHWEDGVCSNCKEEALSTSWDERIYDYDWEEILQYSHTDTHTEHHLTNYCPNCGAKMDEKNNDR